MDEPQALASDILSEIITKVKASRPTRTDGTSTTQGFVYSQLTPGLMVSPRDFARPWSAVGGSGAAAAPDAAAATAEVKRALDAAFNLTELVDTMLVVTDDGTVSTYSGGGKRLSVTYEQILNAMEAVPPPPQDPQVTARIEAAKAVLYDGEGDPTPKYQRYLDNQDAYALARADFTIERSRALGDPARADSWPMLARPYQVRVDQAYDRWKTQGAEEIEAALATMQSIGIPLDQGMIAKARKRFGAWSLDISGIVESPYSYVLPSDWSEIEANVAGWTKLSKSSSSYQRHYRDHGYGLSTGEWSGRASSTGGSAGVGIFGFGFTGTHTRASASDRADYSNTAEDGSTLVSDATDLTVELEYGLCQVVRPWLLTDLFRLRSWYLRGQPAGVISDGTIEGQVGKEEPLLPMITTHFVVIRNVRIKAADWGSTREQLESYWSKHGSSSESSSSSTGGGVSVPVFGPVNVSAGVSRTSSDYRGDFKDENGRNVRDDYGAHFDGSELRINGAQIVAWLSEVLPTCPTIADPALDRDGAGTEAGTGDRSRRSEEE